MAQKSKADSLYTLLAKEKADTTRVKFLWQIADAVINYNPDSSLSLARKSLSLAQKIKYTEGESRATGVIGSTFIKIGNYPKALEYYLQKLRIEEQRTNPHNLAITLINIGTVYFYQEEYRKGLPYYFKADSLIDAEKLDDLKYYTSLNLGDIYYRLNVIDSSFLFNNRALRVAIMMNDSDLIASSQVNLGNCYAKEGDDSTALSYYKIALPPLYAANDDDMICEATLGMAKIFKRHGLNDSASYYATQSFKIARNDGFLLRELEAATFLASHFRETKYADSAFVYNDQVQLLKDSISSKDKIRQSQIISSNEQLRQLQIEEAAAVAKEERRQQLQLLFIGIFIPAVFLITLILSRVKIHHKVIKPMGILSLLILFEYLTLLLHPVVAEFTHHTPILELLIFVCIAAILIPAHHRIEHWLIHKLAEIQKKHADARILKKKKSNKTEKPSA